MSEPSAAPSVPRSRTLRAAAAGVAVFGLAASLLEFPLIAYDIGHDASSHASADYFAVHGFQFGADVVQNIGPLGWLHQVHVYSGMLHAPKVVLHAALRIALLVLLMTVRRSFASGLAAAVWLAMPLVPTVFGESKLGSAVAASEVWNDLTVYLAGLVLIALPNRSLRSVPLVALLAVFALEKHTLLAAAGVAVAAGVLERVRRGARGEALAIAAGFAAFLALLWSLAGQRFANLPDYAQGVLRFSEGYNEALGVPASTTALLFGVPIAAALAAVVVGRTLARSQSPAKSLLDAAFLFLAWKHGFVRADAPHVAIFLLCAVSFAFPFALAYERGAAPRRRALGAIAAGVAVAGAAGLVAIHPGGGVEPSRLLALWKRNQAWILSPRVQTGALDRMLREREATYGSPTLRAIVGGAPVDHFGFRPGWVLLNGWQYRPRPMPISFAAANTWLRRRNAAFLRDARSAPPFVLVQLGSIDARLVTLDDGLALGVLFDAYHPVATQGDLVLLERNANARGDAGPERRLVAERTIAIGETLALDAGAADWLWLEVDVQPSALGRARSFLLRPAPLEIELTVAGRAEPERRDYIASMGASGFLITPLVQTGADLVTAYGGGPAPLRAVQAVRFTCDPAHRRFFDPRIRVRILADRAPSAAAHPAAEPSG